MRHFKNPGDFLMVVRTLFCLFLATAPVYADKAESQKNLQKHRQRLEADLAELREKLQRFSEHIWLPDALQTTIKMKEDSLYYVGQAEGMLESLGSETTLRTIGDAQKLGGSNAEDKKFVDYRPSAISQQILTPGELGKAMPLNVKQLRIQPLGLVLLKELQDPETEQIQKEAAESKPVADILDGRAARAKFRELGYQVFSDRYSIELPDLPYLSKILYAAEHLNKVDLERTEMLTLLLGSEELKEVFTDPSTLSATWAVNFADSQNREVLEEEKLEQLEHQETLVSPQDKRQGREKRRQRWEGALNKLLASYHSTRYRTKALEEFRPATEEEFQSLVGSLDAKIPETLPESVDLSHRFQKPRSQGKSNACVAFSLVSDMETFQTPQLSTALAYSLFMADWHLPEVFSPLEQALEKDTGRTGHRLYFKLDRGAQFFAATALLKKEPLSPEQDNPFNEYEWIAKDINSIPNRITRIKKSFEFSTRLSELQLRKLLAAGVTPAILHKYSARSVQEDWIRPEPVSELAHASNLVGYGTAIDPFDLQRKSYFVVRDSFVDTEIHYRVAAEEIVPLIEGGAKVLAVETLAEAPMYKTEIPGPEKTGE
ncbi:hypothetical protein K2X33_01465 [bacterium]|nr:hypothetical protein [bacterium]